MMFLALALLGAVVTPTPELYTRAYQPGEAVLVIVKDAGSYAYEGSFRETKIRFFPGATGEMLALFPIDLEEKLGKATLTINGKGAEGTPPFEWSREIEIEKKEFPTVHLKVPPKFVEPSKAELERHAREQKTLKAIFLDDADPVYWRGAFVSPIDGMTNGVFGERRTFNNEPRSPHSGADLKAKLGTEVRAPAAGKVVLAQDQFFPGNILVLSHGAGLYSFYAHLSEMLAKEGEMVAKGVVIGKVGKTGRVTGPHLHWGMKLYNERIDPFSMVALDFDRWFPAVQTPSGEKT